MWVAIMQNIESKKVFRKKIVIKKKRDFNIKS